MRQAANSPARFTGGEHSAANGEEEGDGITGDDSSVLWK